MRVRALALSIIALPDTRIPNKSKAGTLLLLSHGGRGVVEVPKP